MVFGGRGIIHICGEKCPIRKIVGPGPGPVQLCFRGRTISPYDARRFRLSCRRQINVEKHIEERSEGAFRSALTADGLGEGQSTVGDVTRSGIKVNVNIKKSS